ncbi:MAG TPA: hypothetical protein VG223_15640 [Solirubrobacteraceae bacterium]|jgi:hypothetical protein|nr:hypothetical protein [Solirubrobacteraceae bacterium]
MAMVIGMFVVLAGVVIGWWTLSGSGIHSRPYGRDDKYEGESPLDSPWQMNEWNRGTQSSRRRRR